MRSCGVKHTHILYTNVSALIYNGNISTKGYKMPNWCYNTLTIQGPKSEVDMIKDRLNKPFTLAQETYGMGDISVLWVSPPNLK
jgi:hypothetical protein